MDINSLLSPSQPAQAHSTQEPKYAAPSDDHPKQLPDSNEPPLQQMVTPAPMREWITSSNEPPLQQMVTLAPVPEWITSSNEPPPQQMVTLAPVREWITSSNEPPLQQMVTLAPVPEWITSSNESPPQQMVTLAPVREWTTSSNEPPPQQIVTSAPVRGWVTVRKQCRWTPEEDSLLFELREQGTKWEDIARQIPGRTLVSCRLRYQNYLVKQGGGWDEDKKDHLARVYTRLKDQMWKMVANEVRMDWRAAESLHWQLGEQEIGARANSFRLSSWQNDPFPQLHPSVTPTPPPPSSSPPPLPQYYQPLPPLPQAEPIHSIHQRSDSDSSQGRPLPQTKPASEADLASGARIAPIFEAYSGTKREGESLGFVEPHLRRSRRLEVVSTPASTLDSPQMALDIPDADQESKNVDLVEPDPKKRRMSSKPSGRNNQSAHGECNSAPLPLLLRETSPRG